MYEWQASGDNAGPPCLPKPMRSESNSRVPKSGGGPSARLSHTTKRRVRARGLQRCTYGLVARVPSRCNGWPPPSRSGICGLTLSFLLALDWQNPIIPSTGFGGIIISRRSLTRACRWRPPGPGALGNNTGDQMRAFARPGQSGLLPGGCPGSEGITAGAPSQGGQPGSQSHTSARAPSVPILGIRVLRPATSHPVSVIGRWLSINRRLSTHESRRQLRRRPACREGERPRESRHLGNLRKPELARALGPAGREGVIFRGLIEE